MEHHPYFRTNLYRYHSSEALTVSPQPLLVVSLASPLQHVPLHVLTVSPPLLLAMVVARLVSGKYPDAPPPPYALTVSPQLLLVVVVAPLVSGEAQEEVVLLVLGVVVPLGSRRGSGAAVLRQEGDHVVS
ncbi:hypothetical protein JG688_00014472 [Phytophthora aleatoria]|uniref:Uncharacterized protein n=1 Tax=Phytophthora aleatoria TaxID=2496075 RepID=A0A8J5M395_9STRA|nr:hypothetical protein JG688_00014472 [Phytophthora aleatoria]